MATMKRVAAHANVSVSTVSRVVNQSGYVAPSVRENVLKAVKELGYQPSSIARGLRTSSTRSVGVLVPQLAHPFFGAIAIAAEKHLFAHGYRIFLCSSEEDPDKESAYIDMLLSQRVDGVILVSTGTSEPNAKRLLDAKIPMVLVDRDLPQMDVDRVLADNYKGAQDLVHYLATLGHRQIGIIGANVRRLSSFKDGIAKAGLEFDPKLEVVIEKPTFEMAVAATRKLLKRAHPPTAIMAENDLLAVGVLNGALRTGLHIPADLSVTGFDDVPLAAYIFPELTTVSQPYDLMAERATQCLLSRIIDPRTTPASEILPTRVVVRRSTGPARKR
jgi:LacI family transcriptional regulator